MVVLLWRMRASGSRRGRARSSFDALAVGVSAEDTFLGWAERSAAVAAATLGGMRA